MSQAPVTRDELTRATAQLDQLLFEIRRVIVGQDRVLERILTTLLSRGHCLLEGVPGLGKTLTLATLAKVMGGSFSRIQFTADLLPADVVGTRIYKPSAESFEVERGPVFANVVLADEVNRAPAKAQSALLEVMQEHQVSIGGVTMRVPEPFFVLATQNPIESEGVYPLPEAQRDRFLMRVPVDYPTPAEEIEVVRRDGAGPATVSRLLDPADLLALQALAGRVQIDAPVVDYALRLVLATREPAAHGMGRLEGLLAFGASPRASIGLVRAARSLALLRGRAHALPQDVYDVAYDVLNHRVTLSFTALADGITLDDVLVDLLRTVPAPRLVPVATSQVAVAAAVAAAAPVAATPTATEPIAPSAPAGPPTGPWPGRP